MRYHIVILTILTFFLLFCTKIHAQNIQWVSKIHFQYNEFKETGPWSAENLIGPPDSYPLGSLNENAFRLIDEKAYGTVTVGFEKPQTVKEIVIVENFKPGRVSKILIYDQKGTEYTLIEKSPQELGIFSRVLTVPVEGVDFLINKISIHINCINAPGRAQIDAIGISDTPLNDEMKKKISKSEETIISEDISFTADKERLSGLINTPYKEMKPIISPDGRTLYFVRQDYPMNIGGKKDMQDIYYSDNVGNKWRLAQNIGEPLNDSEPNGICSISPDGNTILVINSYHADGTMDGTGVSISHRTSKGWTAPLKLDIENFSNKNRYQDFYLSNSGQYLLMAVEMTDTYGDQDLYVSFRKGEGSYSTPINLSNTINTSGVEYSPFLAADNRTLYFSSDGHGGFGGSDIFYTRRLDETWQRWSEPVNIGDKINSKNWDAYYTVTARGDYAYFVSTDDALSKKEVNEDIYRISLSKEVKPDPVVMITGRVLDKKSQQPIQAEINYESLTDNSEEGIAISNEEDGEFKIVIPAGKKYGFLAKSKGYISLFENADFSDVSEYQEKSMDLYLIPIEKGQIVQLNNLFFEQSKAEILPESESELERLYQLMIENPDMEIELKGHTDNQGYYKSNLELSQERADAVYEFLVDQGISKRRLSAKGYGPTMPLAPNSNPEGRAKNRRVEVEILSL